MDPEPRGASISVLRLSFGGNSSLVGDDDGRHLREKASRKEEKVGKSTTVETLLKSISTDILYINSSNRYTKISNELV